MCTCTALGMMSDCLYDSCMDHLSRYMLLSYLRFHYVLTLDKIIEHLFWRFSSMFFSLNVFILCMVV